MKKDEKKKKKKMQWTIAEQKQCPSNMHRSKKKVEGPCSLIRHWDSENLRRG